MAVDWQALEGIGGVATAIAVVIALVFGVVQIRLQAGQRRDLASAQILANMLTREFVEAIELVLALPDDAPADLVRDRPEVRKAVVQLDFAFEALGTMVHARLLPLHDVDRLMGNLLRASWRRARAFTDAERERLGEPSRGEWWQWLVERMDEDPAPGKAQGAHVAFRAWRR